MSRIQVEYENRFVMLNYDAVMGGQLTANELAVYVILCAFASNTDRTCFPSYRTLANKAGCCRRTVISIVARLEELGYIEKQSQPSGAGDSTSNRYIIKSNVTKAKTESASVLENTNVDNSVDNYVDNQSLSVKPVQEVHHSGAPDSPPPVNGLHHRGAGAAPELNIFKYTYFNYPHSSIRAGAGEDGTMDLLKTEIDYEYFETELPDRLPFLDSLIAVILSLRREDKPENQRLLTGIDSCAITEFMEDIKDKDICDVRNLSAWLRTVFMEFLRKRDAQLKDFW